jgi:hypothetical protein
MVRSPFLAVALIEHMYDTSGWCCTREVDFEAVDNLARRYTRLSAPSVAASTMGTPTRPSPAN